MSKEKLLEFAKLSISWSVLFEQILDVAETNYLPYKAEYDEIQIEALLSLLEKSKKDSKSLSFVKSFMKAKSKITYTNTSKNSKGN